MKTSCCHWSGSGTRTKWPNVHKEPSAFQLLFTEQSKTNQRLFSGFLQGLSLCRNFIRLFSPHWCFWKVVAWDEPTLLLLVSELEMSQISSWTSPASPARFWPMIRWSDLNASYWWHQVYNQKLIKISRSRELAQSQEHCSTFICFGVTMETMPG